MALIYERVHRHLVATDRLGELKLGTSGRYQDVFYIASKEEMWELFKVTRAEASGEDNVVVKPVEASCTHWGITPAMATAICAATVAEARRL